MSTLLTTFVTVMDTCRGGARAGSAAAHALSREHGDGGVHSLALLSMTHAGDVAAADGRGGHIGGAMVVTCHSGLGLTHVVMVWGW
jgi:hypothetical protein